MGELQNDLQSNLAEYRALTSAAQRILTAKPSVPIASNCLVPAKERASRERLKSIGEPVALAKAAFCVAEAHIQSLIFRTQLRVFARAASNHDCRFQTLKTDLPSHGSKPTAELRLDGNLTMRSKYPAFLVLIVFIHLPARSEAQNFSTATACSAANSESTIRLRVGGFKRQTGTVNLWVYGGNPRDFLVRDKRILRLAYPVPQIGPMEACIALPGPGRYAIAAHHDVQSNDKRDMSDGLGFSGNPRLSALRLKPTYAQTSFVVGRTTGQVNLVLLYRSGLSIRAVAPQAR